MRKQWVKWLCAGLCGLLASCAIITVNVYFPEKDVKQAYKSLDEMLLKQGNEGTTPPAEGQPAGTDEKKKEEEVKPQSRLFDGGFNLSLIAEASAQEPVADQLAVELASMPEVLKAYGELKARLPQLNTLRDSGAVGENKQGLLTILDKGKLGGNEPLVKAVNDNRKIVITGMAKAILKINKQPATDKGIKQVLGKAAATYADIRHENAQPGWWIELANGKWVQK
ncbi:MAG TPA: DUF1318 domain-containing protein [Geobacteraceae bacterium]